MTHRKTPFLPLLLAAALLSPLSGAAAQTPTVKDVYDRFATAVGGRDAWAKVTGRTEKGTTDVTFAGLSGFYERHSAPAQQDPHDHRSGHGQDRSGL